MRSGGGSPRDMSHRPSRATCWQKKFIKRSSLSGDQLPLHKVVESSLKTTPGGTERVRGNDFFEQMRIECAEPWSENAAVGLIASRLARRFFEEWLDDFF